MSTWMSYLLGLATLPVLTGLGFLHIKLVMRDATISRECRICGYATGRDRPIVRWFKWRWHDATRGWKAWHRDALDAYQREWRVGKYRNQSAESSEWVTTSDGEEVRVGQCQGHAACPVERHEHGCYADLDGSKCDHPDEHGSAVQVHNHGAEDGPGLSCRERRIPDGSLRGACLGPADPVAEVGMPCASTEPHTRHVWQMSATGYCLCDGIPEPADPSLCPPLTPGEDETCTHTPTCPTGSEGPAALSNQKEALVDRSDELVQRSPLDDASTGISMLSCPPPICDSSQSEGEDPRPRPGLPHEESRRPELADTPRPGADLPLLCNLHRHESSVPPKQHPKTKTERPC